MQGTYGRRGCHVRWYLPSENWRLKYVFWALQSTLQLFLVSVTLSFTVRMWSVANTKIKKEKENKENDSKISISFSFIQSRKESSTQKLNRHSAIQLQRDTLMTDTIMASVVSSESQSNAVNTFLIVYISSLAVRLDKTHGHKIVVGLSKRWAHEVWGERELCVWRDAARDENSYR